MFDHILFDKNAFDGHETAVSSDFIISSYGNMIADFDITYNLEISIGGSGGVGGQNAEEFLDLELLTPLFISLVGASKIEVIQLGNTDISYIYLEGLDLAPGEEIVIDTDLLITIINGIYDVSGITSDSVFFELGPGINELIFYPEYDNYPEFYSDPLGNELDISLIWQNRWL